MTDDIEEKEYFALLEAVAQADQRLLTIKGWGVTLSLAALGFGFQYRAYGLFLVAGVSSASFWLLEAAVKRHQMRYYPRMREIEYRRYVSAPRTKKGYSAPRVDWSWATAGALLRQGKVSPDIEPSGKSAAYRRIWLAPHVALPHLLTFLAAMGLFALGMLGLLPEFSLGAGTTK